jgi:hypothetical protein
MKLIYKDVPKVIPENEMAYFSILESVVNSIDELSTLEIRKNVDNYSFRVAITSPSYLSPLVEQLNHLHNLLRIHVNYSKSIKSSSSLSYKIAI